MALSKSKLSLVRWITLPEEFAELLSGPIRRGREGMKAWSRTVADLLKAGEKWLNFMAEVDLIGDVKDSFEKGHQLIQLIAHQPAELLRGLSSSFAQ